MRVRTLRFVPSTKVSFALDSRRYRVEMVGGVENLAQTQTCSYYKVGLPHTYRQLERGRWDSAELRIESTFLTSYSFLPRSSSPMHGGLAARFLQYRYSNAADTSLGREWEVFSLEEGEPRS